MLGVATNGFGTYTSVVRPDGSIYGEGQGGDVHLRWRVGLVEGLRPGKIRSGRDYQLPRDSVFSDGIAEAGAVKCNVRRLRIRGGCGRRDPDEDLGVDVSS